MISYKKYIYALLIMVLTSLVYAQEVEDTIRLKSINNEIIVDRQVYILNTDSVGTTYSDARGSKFSSSSDIIVKFKNTDMVNIADIEAKYGLKFIRKMTIGDVVFKNIGVNDTLMIINLMIENIDLNIVRIMPDMVFNMHQL